LWYNIIRRADNAESDAECAELFNALFNALSMLRSAECAEIELIICPKNNKHCFINKNPIF